MQHSPCNYALINYIPFDMLIFTVPKNKQLIIFFKPSCLCPQTNNKQQHLKGE